MLYIHLKGFPEDVDFQNFELKGSHFQDHSLFEGLFFGYFNESSILWSKILDEKLMLFLCDFCMPVRHCIFQDQHFTLQIWTNQRSIFSNFVKFWLVPFVVSYNQLFASLHLNGCFGRQPYRRFKISISVILKILFVFFQTDLDPFNHFFYGNFGGDAQLIRQIIFIKHSETGAIDPFLFWDIWNRYRKGKQAWSSW